MVARKRRYKVALRFVRKGMSSTDALKSLLLEAQDRGLRVAIVYADKALVESVNVVRAEIQDATPA